MCYEQRRQRFISQLEDVPPILMPPFVESSGGAYAPTSGPSFRAVRVRLTQRLLGGFPL